MRHPFCAECSANLEESDPDNIGMCGHCGSYAPKRKSKEQHEAEVSERRSRGARDSWEIRREKAA